MVRLAVLADQVVLAVSVVQGVLVAQQRVEPAVTVGLMATAVLAEQAATGGLAETDSRASMVRIQVTLVLTGPMVAMVALVEWVDSPVQGVVLAQRPA